MTKLEKELAKMTPAQRKATGKAISDMMGRPTKKKKPVSKKKKTR